LAVIALFALCAIAFAEDAPDELLPCSFYATFKMVVRTEDGEELATSMNEIIRDNGDYWLWKNDLNGNAFIQSMIPDHSWAIVWRPDVNRAFRIDYSEKGNNCLNLSLEQQPLPYDWIQSKTYGIVWYDEIVSYQGRECNLHTAILIGNYRGKADFEAEANFFVSRTNGNLLYVNGSLQANKKEIDVVFESQNMYFEHNKEIAPKTFAVAAPCNPLDPPSGPSADFKAKCYHEGSAVLSLSWFILLAALLIALMNF